MKKAIQISGIFSAIVLLLGNVFKTFHQQGAGLLISLGIISFVIVFTPARIIKTLQSENSLRSKIRISFGSFLASIMVTGVLFKIMHWPTANILICSAIVLFIIAYIPMLFFKTLNSANDLIDKIRSYLGYTVASLFATGILFKIMHWEFALNLAYLSVSFLTLVFLPFYIFSKFNKSVLYESIISTVYVMIIGGAIYTLIDLSNI
jgi:hypothetical protein